jgi:hypothetical protein
MSSIADASILGGYLSPDNLVDTITDDSRASKTGSLTSIDIGDIIYGVMQITSITTSGNVPPTDIITPPTVGVFFSARVNAGDGITTPYILGPTPLGGTFSLDAIAPTLFAASGASAADLAKSIFLVGSHPGALNLTLENTSALQSIIDADAAITAGPGGYEATGGIQVGLNAHGDLDFFRASYNTSDPSILDETGGFTIFDRVFGNPLLPVTITGTDHDTTLSGRVFPMEQPSVYLFDDDARFRINRATPEPVSLVVWGGILGLGGLVARRRYLAA